MNRGLGQILSMLNSTRASEFINSQQEKSGLIQLGHKLLNELY